MIPFSQLVQYGNTVKIGGFDGNYVQETWSTLWSTRAEQGSCVDPNGNAYVMGGVNSGTYYNSFWKYTYSTDTWSALTNFSSVRDGPAMAYDEVNNAVYSFGGSTGVPALSNKKNDLYKYDVQQGTWGLVSPTGTVPGARVHGSMVYINSKMYIFGSYYTEAVAKTLSVYNISTNAYTTLAEAPYAFAYGSSSVRVGSDFVTVGVNGSTYYLMKYTVSTDTWSILSTTTIPLGRIAYYKNIIVAFGFNNGTMYRNKLESGWDTLSTIPNYNINCQVFINIKDEYILTIGGKSSSGTTNTLGYKLT